VPTYIRITQNPQEQPLNYHLVESYRHNGKVKQRTLISLGKGDDNHIQETIHVLQKFTQQVSAINDAKKVGVENAYLLGPAFALEKA
jgi:hypothetical protein